MAQGVLKLCPHDGDSAPAMATSPGPERSSPALAVGKKRKIATQRQRRQETWPPWPFPSPEQGPLNAAVSFPFGRLEKDVHLLCDSVGDGICPRWLGRTGDCGARAAASGFSLLLVFI